MELKEIIALAKAGYKKKDIEELLKLSTDTPQSDDIQSGPPSGNEEASEETQELPTPEEEPKEEPNPLIEEQKKQIKKLTDELKKAQESAVRTDMSKDEPSEEDVLADIFRKFM